MRKNFTLFNKCFIKTNDGKGFVLLQFVVMHFAVINIKQ